MLRLTSAQRALLADKLFDVANLVVAALAIGFLLGEPRATIGRLLATLVVWVSVMLLALLIARGEG